MTKLTNNEEHTKEPWGHMAGMPTNVLCKSGLRVARCDFDGDFKHPKAHANARRIVACVNACEDILDYELSLGCVARLSEQLRTVTKQRDELLAAVEAIEINAEECMSFDESTAMVVPIDDYHKLMEAIATITEVLGEEK